MATYTLWYRGQGSTTSGKAESVKFPIRPTYFNSDVDANIPPYSIINKAIVILEIKRDDGSTAYDSDYKWSVYNSSGTAVYNSNVVKSVITLSFKPFSYDFTSYFQSDTAQSGRLISKYDHIAFSASFSNSRMYRVKNRRIEYTYTPPTFVVSATVQGQGSVSGTGTYNVGSTTTLTATPATGYRFIKWSDGNTSATRTITVTQNDISANVTNLSYIAYFELDKIYVTFDSIFNFNKWKDAGIISGSTATISNITNTGFSITADASDSYTNNSHLFTVTPNTNYILEYDAVGNGHEAYVFCDGKVVAGRFWNTTNGVLRFTVPSDCTTIAIRCDSNVSGNTIDYSNIRIYPADYSYMSNSVTATNRSCVNSWNFPTPTRKGYDFLGWNTKPDGSGTTYNSSSTFPKSDLVLYSQWKISKINKIYIGTSQPKSIYVGTSEVKAVYVGTTKVYG